MRNALALAALLLGLPPSSVAAPLPDIPARPGERLEVVLDQGGSIAILGEERASVAVETEGGGYAPSELEVAREGRTLRIRGARARGVVSRLVLRVPQRFDVDLETAGGDLTIDAVTGAVRARSGGGELVLRGLSGTVDAETRGGDVLLARSEVDGRLRTMSGDLSLQQVTGNVSAATMAGNVIFAEVRPAASGCLPVEISTKGGDITVGTIACGARLETLGGDIRVARSAGSVEARTLGGDILLGDLAGSVHATTGGGKITARVVTGQAQSAARSIALESAGGDIQLELPAEFPMTVDVQLEYTRAGAEDPGDSAIASEFALDVRRSPSWDYSFSPPRKQVRARGVVGAGTHRVDIDVRDGRVKLLRAP